MCLFNFMIYNKGKGKDMSKVNAVVYTSNTGHTYEYAKMVAEYTGLPVYSQKKKNKLQKNSSVIYMGWLFAGTVKGYRKAIKRFKVTAVIGVGLCGTGELTEKVRISNLIPENVALFTVQGGMNHGKLKGINKLMINALMKSMSGKSDMSKEEAERLALLRQGGYFVSRDNLADFFKWYNTNNI